MDEVITVWTIRLPDASQIYSALMRGAQFSPPAFHLALHYYSLLVGESPLALRLPSIVAVLLTGLCSFVIFRRQLGNAAAIFACCLLLRTLLPYGLQVRPYALITCCFAAALLLWDDFNRREGWWRCVLLAGLLAFAVSLHFYSVLLVPCFGLMELFRAFRTRRIRPAMWIALFVAGAAIFLWLPLIHAMVQYNGEDTSSPAYYAKPELFKFIEAYCDLVLEGPSNIFLVLAAAVVIGVARFRGFPDSPASEEGRGERRLDFWTMVFGTVLLPLIVFLFSAAVTKTFEKRYIIAGAIGLSALIAGGFGGVPMFRRAVPLLVLLASFVVLNHGSHYFGEFDRAFLYDHVPGPYPVVVADGVQFFPLEEAAPPGVRSRLVYLTLPRGVKAADPTNQNQIERWKTINPNLRVENVDEFLRSNPRFYVFDTRQSDDTPATYLLDKHVIELTSQANGILIYKSRSASAADEW
jgi:hypothetical protein